MSRIPRSIKEPKEMLAKHTRRSQAGTVLTDVKVVGVANVDASDTDTTEILHGLDALVDDLTGVCLKASSKLDGVSPSLGVFASDALNGDVGTAAVAHLLQLRNDALATLELGEVDSLDPGIPLSDEIKAPVLVDHDNSACFVHQGELGTHLANGTSTPDCNNVALVDASVHNTIPAGADHVRKVQTLLIGDIVGKLQQVVVAVRYASVFGLTTSEAAGEMRITKHTSGPATVHGVLDCVGVGALALGGLLLLAVVAISTRNLEACNHSVALLQVLDAWSHFVHNAAELVAEDVALLKLNDRAMVEVKVAAADGAAGDLQNHVAVFEQLGFGSIDYAGLC